MRAAGIVLLAIIAAATSATAVDAYRSRTEEAVQIEELSKQLKDMRDEMRAIRRDHAAIMGTRDYLRKIAETRLDDLLSEKPDVNPH